MKHASKTVKRKPQTSAGGIARELIRADMKKMKEASRGLEKFSANGMGRKNGATRDAANAPVVKHPGTALEAAGGAGAGWSIPGCPCLSAKEQ